MSIPSTAWLCLALLASTADARPRAGSVLATTARWASPALIVTDLDIVDDDGERHAATALGGVVDGIGMEFSHHPIPSPRDRITFEIEADRVRIRSIEVSALVGASAHYAIKRTTSGTPVWRSTCLSFVYDSTPIDDVPNVHALIDRAFAAWTTNCGHLVVERSVGPAPSALDGASTIAFRDDRWCRPAAEAGEEVCYSPEAAATTRTVYVNLPGDPEDGRILETDIEINAVDFAFFHDGQSREVVGEPVDFLSVMTHEIGHALGLAHNCAAGDESPGRDLDGVSVPRCEDVAADPSYTLATMFPAIGRGEEYKRTLAASDLDAACAVLRRGACEVESTGCATLEPSWGIALFVLVWLCTRRRRALACVVVGACAGPAVEEPGDHAAAVDVAMAGLTTDYFSGAAVANVILATRGFAPELRAVSDRDGAYAVQGVPVGSQFFLATEADERYLATVSTHAADAEDVFAEAPMVARADAKRQAATLGVSIDADTGVIFVDVERGGAPAVNLSLADVALVDQATGEPITGLRAAWFGSLGDVDPRIVTSFAANGRVRLAIVGVPAGTYDLAIGADADRASVAIEVTAEGAAVAAIDLASAASTGTDFATVYTILQRARDGGDGCATCHTSNGPAALLVMDDGADTVRARLRARGVVDFADPTRSLLLRRPLYEVPADHPNATWLTLDDPSAQSVLAWIEAGGAP